jgi:hypothetical protein
MIRRNVIVAIALLGLALGPLALPARAEPGEELSVHLLTIGPGDHSSFGLGQSAIWIQDERASRGVVYDFGPLKPDSFWSLLTWLSGRLSNRVSRVSIDEALQHYRRDNRSIETQALEIPPGARLALRTELETSALPENRNYKYDPFLNSGSIRARDAIDRVTGGRLRPASQFVPDGLTLRQQTLRLTHSLWTAYLIGYLGQGAASDRPLDEWGRMFVPKELQKTLRRIGRAGSWNDPPLLESEATIFAAHREVPPRDRPFCSRCCLLAGLAIGTVLALAGWASRRRPPLRIVFGVMMGMIGLGLGLLGTALLLGWCFGDHLAIRRNENILQLAPWGLVLPLLVTRVAEGRPGTTGIASRITAAAAACAGLGLLLKVTPWFNQDNWPVIGLLLPTWVGLLLGLRALGRE